MNCPNCKNPINENDENCNWCGSQLELKFNIDDDILEFIKENHILAAVKLCMERLNISMYESKMFIDGIREKLKNKNLEINLLPNVCPHCKNPNNKQIRICEWCGGQIV